MGTNDAKERGSDNAAMDELVEGDISSLNALAGLGNPRSLRLLGELASHRAHVLIDSGSTHNFIKPCLVERLNLPIQPTSKFRVCIGNDDFLLCQHACLQVELLMQGTVFKVVFLCCLLKAQM